MTKKLFIGLPCYDGYNPKFAVSLISALPKLGPAQIFTLDGDSLIPRARNNLAAEFLESQCTHLLFLDTDLEFGADALAQFVQNDKDVAAGVYFQKRHDAQIPVFNRLPDKVPGQDGLAEVRHAGTGIMMIARHVLEKLIETGAAPAFMPSHGENRTKPLHEFFPIGVFPNKASKWDEVWRLKDEADKCQSKEDCEMLIDLIFNTMKLPPSTEAHYESEDWAFCRMVREAGMEVWIDMKFAARHHGHGVYPCEPVEQLRERQAKVLQLCASHPGELATNVRELLEPALTEVGRR